MLLAQAMLTRDRETMEKGDDTVQQSETESDGKTVINGGPGRAHRKNKDSGTEGVDAAVAARLKEADNAEAAKKKFAAVLERFDECLKVVRVC